MSDYEPPHIAVSVDVAVFTERDGRPMVVLIERGNEPYEGSWALPGGFVEIDEDLPDAASRELAEETGLVVPPSALTQVGAYGAPGRDPRMRVVSVLHWAFVPGLKDPVGGSDAAASKLIPVEEALTDQFAMAFDHPIVLRDAVAAAGL